MTADVRKRAEELSERPDPDPVHDMRTATRRLRTAIVVYRDLLGPKRRARVEDELKRVAGRLGAVRDLDVLIATVDEARERRHESSTASGLDDLRRAWADEREALARRLRTEIDRSRFERCLDVATRLVRSSRQEGNGTSREARVERVADQAPGLVWTAFGKVLSFELDPRRANPALIHRMRIAAKKLRYTLEAFEGAIDRATSLIEPVTALQDAAGEMHDAIVARDRARSFLDEERPPDAERRSIEAFARAQDRRASSLRRVVARDVQVIRSPAFRQRLGRAMSGM